MKTFRCSQCDHPVYFENTACAACGAALGYLPSEAAMAAFEVTPAGPWKALGNAVEGQWKPCANYTGPQVCNWMVAADDPSALCACCRQTEVIPTLEKPDNALYWARLEAAIAMEDRNQILCAQDGDFGEGVRAFLEKRRPVYAVREG